MKSIVRGALLSSVAALVGSAAVAADLPTRKAAIVPPPAMLAWDGFYLGVNAGYGWTGANNVVNTALPGYAVLGGLAIGRVAALQASPTLPLAGASGFLAGGQAGYNKRFGSVLIGWESDLTFFGAGSKQAGLITNVAGPSPVFGVTPYVTATNVSAKQQWLTTTRLRVGYLALPSLLIYGTGGVAAGAVRATTGMQQALPAFGGLGVVGGGGFGSYSSTRIGYAVGAGAEWMFMPGWSVRAEYLYYNLGRANYGVSPVTTTGPLGTSSQAFPTSSVRFDGQMVRLGLNYFWDWRSMLPAAASAGSPQYSAWNGYYIGANVGYGWSGSNGVSTVAWPGAGNAIAPLVSRYAATLLNTRLPSSSANGFLGGGQIGTQHQIGSFVVGWEMDLQAMGAGSGRSSTAGITGAPVLFGQIAATAAGTNKVDWLSTSRARAGYLVTPSILIYGTAGFAMGGVKSTMTTSLLTTSALNRGGYGYGVYSQARFGYSGGAGVEWAVTPSWSVRAEYLYYDLGRAYYQPGSVTASVAIGPVPLAQANLSASTRFNGSLVRAGVNYHWNWDAPAVVAKY